MFVFYIYYFPDVLFNVIALADIGNFFGAKFDPTTEYVDEFGIKNTTGCRVTSHIEVRHSDPLISAYIVVLASFVEILGVVTAYHIDSILIPFIDGGKI